MKTNDLDVLSCFVAKSWIPSKDDQSDVCHAFRVCVKLEDRLKVLDGALWPEGVLVRELKFKNKNEDGGQ